MQFQRMSHCGTFATDGGAQQSVDLSANANGFVATCSGTATFVNAGPDLNFAQAQVQRSRPQHGPE